MNTLNSKSKNNLIKPKKSLGQHFLHDKNIVWKIVDAISATVNDRVVEIGAGTGALTKMLISTYSDVQVIEIDERAVTVLEKEFPDLHIHRQDVLQTEWKHLKPPKGRLFVVGNLPYYITSPILFSLLEERVFLEEAILMMQKEVAQRLSAKTGTKDYGILSVQTQLMCTPEILFDVSPNSFTPPPGVQSSVIRLTFDKGLLGCTDENLKKVVRTAFNQRRKKLSNSLKPVLGDYRPEGFDFDARAERWEPHIYEKLTVHLEEAGKLAD